MHTPRNQLVALLAEVDQRLAEAMELHSQIAPEDLVYLDDVRRELSNIRERAEWKLERTSGKR